MIEEDEIEVTIFDAEGKVVVHEICKAQIASQEQIDAMVAMINSGVSAHEASALVLSGNKQDNLMELQSNVRH